MTLLVFRFIVNVVGLNAVRVNFVGDAGHKVKVTLVGRNWIKISPASKTCCLHYTIFTNFTNLHSFPLLHPTCNWFFLIFSKLTNY